MEEFFLTPNTQSLSLPLLLTQIICSGGKKVPTSPHDPPDLLPASELFCFEPFQFLICIVTKFFVKSFHPLLSLSPLIFRYVLFTI